MHNRCNAVRDLCNHRNNRSCTTREIRRSDGVTGDFTHSRDGGGGIRWDVRHRSDRHLEWLVHGLLNDGCGGGLNSEGRWRGGEK